MENRMEEEILREEREKNKIILLVVFGLFLLVFLFFIIFNAVVNKNDKDGDYIINNSTLSDEDSSHDESKITNVEKNGDEIYIYQKGYEGMAPISFTYQCKSTMCSLITNDKSFVLYDDEKLIYRET